MEEDISLKINCEILEEPTLVFKFYIMNRILLRSTILVAIITLVLVNGINAQDLLKSRQGSYYTYIYRISNEEAKSIYKNSLWVVDLSYFHSLADSFPTDSQYTRKLPPGHYLRTHTEGNRQQTSIATVQDFDVRVMNNNTDLCVQVFDINGNPVTDANVRVRSKTLTFDWQKQMYVDKKSNQRGMLEVSCGEQTVYYNLSRDYNNSAFKRGWHKVVYGTPLRYIWRPVRYIVRLPIDATRSIVKRYGVGVISRTRFYLAYKFEKIASFFYSLKYPEYDYEFQYKHSGYLVMNKPKYRPGDTVSMKAFITNNNGKPIKKEINVSLQSNGKTFQLAKLKPYRPGAYTFEFALHDSLQLKLDKDCYLSITNKRNKSYISGSFRFEDYELKKNRLSVEYATTEHYKNSPFEINIKGTDENGLNLQDARVQIMVKAKSVSCFLAPQVFIPDTILFFERKLNPAGETAVQLSDSTFPAADFRYEVVVRLLSSDNEMASETKNIAYIYNPVQLEMTLINDSLNIRCLKNGISIAQNAVVTSIDGNDNEIVVHEGMLPCKIGINPLAYKYVVNSGNLTQSMKISDEPSMIQSFGKRTKDSLLIKILNPRKIPFSYDLYCKNKHVLSGYSDTLDIKLKDASKETYYLNINYLWGGALKEESRQLAYVEKELNIEVQQPAIVYPGQKATIEVSVTDFKGKPVEGVDLTAYSMTKKFNYEAPGLPYFGKHKRGKSIINNFKLKAETENGESSQRVELSYWKSKARLDTIEYYHFLYPGDLIYRFGYYAADSITQFSPFVVRDGDIQAVQVVYIDLFPVFFNWSAASQPYSFRIDSGYHQIGLRTNNRTITIDSLWFNEGEKLILSLEETLNSSRIHSVETTPEITPKEQALLYKYIMPYRNNFNRNYAYLKQEENIQFLSPVSKNGSSLLLAGPVSGQFEVCVPDSFSEKMRHEPLFEYEFADGLVKMRSISPKLYPHNLNSYHFDKGFSEMVQTEQGFLENWENLRERRKFNEYQYIFAERTMRGNGILRIDFAEMQSDANKPLCIVLQSFTNSHYFGAFPGGTTIFHNLSPDKYRLTAFYAGERYSVSDTIEIKANGVNYFLLENLSLSGKDSLYELIDSLIVQHVYRKPDYSRTANSSTGTVTYLSNCTESGQACGTLKGKVTDKETGEPIPFCSVYFEEKAEKLIGAITDFDGNYCIRGIPTGNYNVKSTYLGYIGAEIQNVNVFGNRVTFLDIELQASALNLACFEIVCFKEPMIEKDACCCITVNCIESMPSMGSPNIAGYLTTLPGVVNTRGSTANIEIIYIDGVKMGSYNLSAGDISRGANYDNAFSEAAAQNSSIRKNFADDAFWQPKLTTNKDGKTSFEVVFPDDVTCWDTYFLAMNDKKQTGQTSGSIKSYKPLMAQLSVPLFMVDGDTTNVIGKILNYSPDSIRLSRFFEIGDMKIEKAEQYCTNVIIDTIAVFASDSVSVKYQLNRPDGYFDGELREIPVFPLGLKKTVGSFNVLDTDTVLNIASDSSLGICTIYASADALDVLETEISNVINYRFNCNEQIASKLKALIAEKSIAEFGGKKFGHDREVKDLIKLINKNKRPGGLWGWWKDSETNIFISLHVIEALIQAKDQGYDTPDLDFFAGELIWQFKNSTDFNTQIRLLNILSELHAQINYSNYINSIQPSGNNSLNNLLLLIELKQKVNLPYNLDTIQQFQQRTLKGNVYYSDGGETSIQNNDIQNTVIAYRILKADSGHDETLLKMRNYFFENRVAGSWQNTYESVQIIETILPDMLNGDSQLIQPSMSISGDTNLTVGNFPFSMTMPAGSKLVVSKSGSFPIYLSSSQHTRDKSPKAVEGDFVIATHFRNDSAAHLTAGREVTMVVKVVVKKNAEYVMIKVPIPGGCSYASKNRNVGFESHREYYRNETIIFCEHLPEGSYSFEIKILPRFLGIYTLNPAKIELMYFPVFNANNELKQVKIK
ncbi:MAG: hypothetical protein CVU11_14535 [Bacteroidetes bacterium HGW-Bacteroidetes-6]|nr:MAG: hypothetical protein CVU11_14535 [Bacteroidetes bacterium HGW-Bacteroidetes-6]